MKKLIITTFLLSLFISFSFTNIYAESENTFQVGGTNVNKKNVKGVNSENVNDLFSGAGVYSIALNFPKGPLNIIPKLSFSYNSYSTDSFNAYGYAWGLNLSKINRDSKKGIAEIYTNNDFVVDGEELILIDESKGLYKSKYLNNLNKYYFDNNSWSIIDTKGNTFYYGTNLNSKLSDSENIEKTYSWYLAKQVDIRGNEIIYNYFKDNNQVYIDNITYSDSLYKIQFNYIDKEKSLTSYRTQFEIKTSKLLDNIIFLTNNEEVKKYILNYDTPNDVYSHLISFEENSGTQIKIKHDFSYGTGADMHLLKNIVNNKGLEVSFEYKPSIFYKDEDGNNLNPNLPFNQKTLHKIDYKDNVTDINYSEIFEYAEGAFYYDKNDLLGRQYAGFGKVTKTDNLGKKEIYYYHQGENSKDHPELGEYEDHISKKGRMYRKEIYDYDGNLIKKEITKWRTEFEQVIDSKDDIFLYNEDTGKYKMLRENKTGTGIDISFSNTWNSSWERHIGDFNGDSIDDIFLYNKETGRYYMMREKFDGTGMNSVFAGTWSSGWTIYVGDYNGDNRDDIFLHKESDGDIYIIREKVGEVGFIYQHLGKWSVGWKVHVGDIDGDNKDDIFLYNPETGRYYMVKEKPLLNGIYYPFNATWPKNLNLKTLNVDNDSKEEILLHNEETGKYYMSKIKPTLLGFDYPYHGTWPLGLNVHIIDSNGDGKEDVLLHNEETGKYYISKEKADGTGFDYTVNGTWPLGLSITILDIDGDQDEDIFLYNSETGKYYISKENTSNTILEYPYQGSLETNRDLYIGDYNDDKKDDIFVFNTISGEYNLVRENSNGTGLDNTISGDLDSGGEILVGDFGGIINSENRRKVLKDREVISFINGTNITSKALDYSYDIYSNIIEVKDYGEVTLANDSGDFSDILEDKKISKLSYAKNEDKNLYAFINSQELYNYYGTLSKRKEYLYDIESFGDLEYGNITSEKIFDSTNSYSESKYEYNSNGLLTKTTNPKGFVTNYIYDNYFIYPISVTNAKGFIESYEYNYKIGKPSKVTSINGLETSYTYDNFGRLLSERVKLDSTNHIKQEVVYNDSILPNSVKQTAYLDKLGNDKQETYIYLNGFGNDIQTKKSDFNQFTTSKTEYDSLGNKIYVSYPAFETSFNYTTLDKQTEFGNSYEYDFLNRVRKITNKSGNIIYDYDNLDFTITNQKGISSNYEYDISGNLIKVTEPGNILTNYSYNTLGQLVKIIDVENNERNIIYDISGKRLEIEDLHTQNDINFGKRNYEYDENGNGVKYTTMSGDDITYTYDNLDRPITESFGSDITSFTYDSGLNAKGLLSSYTKGDYSENYSYDIFGNLLSETKNYGSDSYTFNYTYNFAGQKLSETFPDNKTANYIFENGIATGINYDGTNLVNEIEYNPVHKISDIEYGNGAEIKNIYDYENGYRLTKKGLLFSGNQYGLTNYTFDDLGNIINLKEEGTITDFKKDVTYNYDNLNRLLEAKYSDTVKYNYTYNSIGNMLSNSKIGNYTYLDNGRNNPHAVTIAGSINFTYDNNGNIITDNNGNYDYNSKDELVSFTNNSGSTTNYEYNSNGIRVEKVSILSLNKYLNKDYEIEEYTTSSGTEIKTNKYLFFNGTKISTVENKDGVEELIYHHEDHLGGGNIDLSSTGGLIQVVDYLPFGETKTKQNSGNFENKYLFGGKEQDSESNLQYFEARYYDNEVGRFRSIDRVFWEIGITERGINFQYTPQLQNSYAYSLNNPLNYIDSNGENPIGAISAGLKKAGLFIIKKGVQQVVKQVVKKVAEVVVTGVKNAGKELGRKASKVLNSKIDVSKILTKERIAHSFKHVESFFGKGNNQWNKYGEKFISLAKNTLNNPDKILRGKKGKGSETFDRYIKKIDGMNVQADVFTSGKMNGLLKTMTKGK